MNNSILTIILICISASCYAQMNIIFEYNSFELQVLSFEAYQNENIPNKNYDLAERILEETKSATKNNPENFNRADYFNVLSAFLSLNESEANIKMAFQKFSNAEGSCESVIAYENYIKSAKYDPIKKDFADKLNECKSNLVQKPEFDINEYCSNNGLDIELVQRAPLLTPFK